jgi:hypothetical protein
MVVRFTLWARMAVGRSPRAIQDTQGKLGKRTRGNALAYYVRVLAD